MKTRLTKKIFRECENPDQTKTTVLDLTFKQWEERVQTQVKDIEDQSNKKYIKAIIESCRIEADKYFINLIGGKVLLVENQEVTKK